MKFNIDAKIKTPEAIGVTADVVLSIELSPEEVASHLKASSISLMTLLSSFKELIPVFGLAAQEYEECTAKLAREKETHQSNLEVETQRAYCNLRQEYQDEKIPRPAEPVESILPKNWFRRNAN